MLPEMTEEKALQNYARGINCSMTVFGAAAPALGLDEKTAQKIASAFGGGMLRGETCGCVTGALMALGLRFGPCEGSGAAAKQRLLAKKAEFEAAFCEENGSLLCRELLGCDISAPEGLAKARREGRMTSLCPKLACDACAILEDLL